MLLFDFRKHLFRIVRQNDLYHPLHVISGVNSGHAEKWARKKQVRKGALPTENEEVSLEEKRKDERFDLCLNAKILVLSGTEAGRSPVISLFTKDICLGGAFFTTSKPLPVGTEVSVEMVLPLHMLKTLKEEKALLQVEKGIVLRHEPNGMAIAFQKGREIAHQEHNITIH